MTTDNEGKVLFMSGRYEEAFSSFAALASDGDPLSAFHAGYCLLNGYGTARDASSAKSYFVFSSGKIPEANYNLAVMYLHGVGVGKSYKKSMEYMNDAAEMGCIEAQLYLGVAHTLGTVFEPDVVAISLIPYHTPIYRDDSYLIEGEVEIADFEADDEARCLALRQDANTAFSWFRRAASQDSTYVEDFSAKSKYLYARCFLDGLGTDFNLKRANSLMLVAAADGSAEALDYLTTDAPYMLEAMENKDILSHIRTKERLPSPT